MTRGCDIPGCTGDHKGNGLCDKHNKAAKRAAKKGTKTGDKNRGQKQGTTGDKVSPITGTDSGTLQGKAISRAHRKEVLFTHGGTVDLEKVKEKFSNINLKSDYDTRLKNVVGIKVKLKGALIIIREGKTQAYLEKIYHDNPEIIKEIITRKINAYKDFINQTLKDQDITITSIEWGQDPEIATQDPETGEAVNTKGVKVEAPFKDGIDVKMWGDASEGLEIEHSAKRQEGDVVKTLQKLIDHERIKKDNISLLTLMSLSENLLTMTEFNKNVAKLLNIKPDTKEPEPDPGPPQQFYI